MKIISWIKSNKLAAILIIFLLVILGKNWVSNNLIGQTSYQMTESATSRLGNVAMEAPSLKMGRSGIIPPQPDYAPAPEVTDRKVIQSSEISLLVSDVRQSADAIISKVTATGGYMVNSYFSNPGESPTSTVTVRVPASQLTDFLSFLQDHGVKVVSENLSGQDVTDQYVDIERRIAILMQTKTKMEEILSRAVEVSDIVNINNQIINIQSQIDSYKGQELYLDQSAKTARVTIHLSTDEFSLPYAPTDTWRPEVIFKQAVRSLVGLLRSITSSAIWIAVFSVVWIPVLLTAFILIKRSKKQ